MAYRAEFLVDSVLVGDCVYFFSMSFDSIAGEIKIIKSEALKISETNRLGVKVNEVTKTLDHMPSHRTKPTINDVVVGIDDEATAIINRLRRDQTRCKLFPL